MITTYLALIGVLIASAASGIAYQKQKYAAALFAMFWVGYNFCLFATKVFPS